MSDSLEMRLPDAGTTSSALDITPFVSEFSWCESLLLGGFYWRMDFGAVSWREWDDLMMGRERRTVQFRLRSDEDRGGQSTEWRTAVVDQSRASFSQDTSMLGGVKGADRALLLAQKARTRAFPGRSVAEVLRRIAVDNGLTADIEDTRGTRDWYQVREDDWAFARRAARTAASAGGRGDTYLWIDETVMRFRAPTLTDPSTRRYDVSAVENRVGGYSTSYHGREADRMGAATLRGMGFDFDTKAAVTFDMNAASAQAHPALAGRVPRSMADGLRVFPLSENAPARVEEGTRARWGRAAPRYLGINARSRPDLTLRPNTLISMDSNLDGRRQTPFMGRYVVVEVRHTLKKGSIETTFVGYRREAHEGDAQPTGANADVQGSRDQFQGVGVMPKTIVVAQVVR